MREWQSQSHVKWYCRYHVVWVPKYRKKALFGQLRKGVGTIIRELCTRSGVELVEGHALADHVHLCLSIPPKYRVANTVGFLKGKSAIRIHREYLGKDRNFSGFHFWARGYCVSTIGLDEKVIREYIRNQEAEERRQEQLSLGGALAPFCMVEAPSRGLHQTTRYAGGT
jgi:putative transposase